MSDLERQMREDDAARNLEAARASRDLEHARAEDYRDALIAAERRIVELEHEIDKLNMRIFELEGSAA